jgi:uncharacterized protein YxeA
MKKILVTITAVILCFSTMILAQKQSEEQSRLNFLVGEWKSVSVDQNTGKESFGNSSIQWSLGGTWLQWKFVAQLEQCSLEVLTLINYHDEKKQYAFYSFNPYDDEPIPHYGNGLDTNTLRIETNFQGENIWVDFKIKENGDFVQEHSKKTSSGERVITAKTNYSKTK